MVYVLLAPGFEEIEALAPTDILRRAGVEVRTVGVGSREIIGSHGIPVVCDLTEEEANLRDLEMVILPGGMPGAANLEASEKVQALLDHCAQNDRPALRENLPGRCTLPRRWSRMAVILPEKAREWPWSSASGWRKS